MLNCCAAPALHYKYFNIGDTQVLGTTFIDNDRDIRAASTAAAGT